MIPYEGRFSARPEADLEVALPLDAGKFVEGFEPDAASEAPVVRMQALEVRGNRLGGALGLHIDRSIGQVAHPSGEVTITGELLVGPAEPDPLDRTAEQQGEPDGSFCRGEFGDELGLAGAYASRSFDIFFRNAGFPLELTGVLHHAFENAHGASSRTRPWSRGRRGSSRPSGDAPRP